MLALVLAAGTAALRVGRGARGAPPARTPPPGGAAPAEGPPRAPAGAAGAPAGAPAPADAPVAAQGEAILEDLRALGYADWDEDAGAVDGVTLLDAGRSQPGTTLHADERDRVLARDARGRIVHQWLIPGRTQVETFALLPGGALVALSVDEGLTAVDARSRELWSVELAAHHEVVALSEGGFLVPVWVERAHHGRRVRFDELVELDAAGRERGRWSSHRSRAQLAELHPPTPLDRPPAPDEPCEDGAVYDQYHLNSVQVLPATPLAERDARFSAGNLLLCLRNVSLVVLLDRRTHAPLWHFGPGVLDFPHTPRITPQGTLLVFDNGMHRGWSRVLELDPLSGELLWDWRDDPPERFFSPVRGSVQRLPNGNTLVCESERGHAFELDPTGKLVWDFWNPERQDERRQRLYRVLRVDAELVPGADR